MDKAESWTDDDKPLPEDVHIQAAHPLKTGDYKRYSEAQRMVGAKRSKYALIDLVNWVMRERDDSEALRAEGAKRCADLMDGSYAEALREALNGARFGLMWIAHNEDEKLPAWARDIATEKLTQADAALVKNPIGENDVDGGHQRSSALPDAQAALAGHLEQDGTATVVTAGETAVPCPLRGPSGCSDSRHCADEPYCAGLRRASASGADAPLTVSVPREATFEMTTAAGDSGVDLVRDGFHEGMRKIWRAMIDAAPSIQPQMGKIEPSAYLVTCSRYLPFATETLDDARRRARDCGDDAQITALYPGPMVNEINSIEGRS